MNNPEIWTAAEKLVSPQPVQREEGLDYLVEAGVFCESPLGVFFAGNEDH
jgi:hypothetical protein